MELNLNMLFDKLTNFKIKFTEKPSPTDVSNKDLVFIADEGAGNHSLYTRNDRTIPCRVYKFKEIVLNQNADTVEIILE